MSSKGNREPDLIRQAAHDWRVVLNSPRVDDADRARFEKWLEADPRHEDAYDRAVSVWSALGHLSKEDLDDDLLRPSWRERLSIIADNMLMLFGTMKLRVAAGGALAAAIAVGVLVLPNHQTGPDPSPVAVVAEPVLASYASSIGKTKTLMLSDGSIVTLGPATEIETSFSDRVREVRLLAGAALFDVASERNRPFSVKAGQLMATALGTKFDVRSNGGVYRVAVAEGKVGVRFPFLSNEEPSRLVSSKELQAGQRIAATTADGLGAVRSVDAESVGVWREARLVYDGATISELVADANRYSERRIEIVEDDYRTVATLKITGAFSGHDIDGMLVTLADIHPVTVDESDPQVVRIHARTVSPR